MLNRSFIAILLAATVLLVAVSGCLGVACSCPNGDGANGENGDNGDNGDDVTAQYPKIASWLAKKDEIIDSGKPFSLVMTAWFLPDEAEDIRAQNPSVILLAGLSINFLWDNPGQMEFLETIASYGREEPLEITEGMYLRTSGGQKCPFGWASEEWGQEEIYAMDPTSNEWVELVTSFYENVLEQPQHDGIIVDMVIENPTAYWPDAISDQGWVEATKSIMTEIDELNTENKLVVFNAGREFADIDEYGAFMDGYLMENFMGDQCKTTYRDGLRAADDDYIVIYGVDTDDTGTKDMNKMRLGLTLSLLNDDTYFAYDFGPRDHGQAWWFPEYDADLGEPLGDYYEHDSAYWREFDNGVVVSSPDVDVDVVFSEEHTDVTTDTTSTTFSVEAGDGRIFIKSAA